jgi:hypothetical protein
MGRGDNKRTKKMRNRKSQNKMKARIKKRAAAMKDSRKKKK